MVVNSNRCSERSLCRLPAWLLLALCCTGIFALPCTRAQNAAGDISASEAVSPMTLHVYAAHVQLPALVLNSSLHSLAALSPDRFAIRLDSGQPFRPSALRLEGEDPITLAVLLDLGGEQTALANEIAPALIRLRTQELQPRDRLLLYAVDCATIRFRGLMPTETADIEHALQTVLTNPALHGSSRTRSCRDRLHLWDSMVAITNELALYSGRRVLLALTSGEDHASHYAWNTLRSMATENSVAIFAAYAHGPEGGPGGESILSLLCTRSGGLVLPLPRHRDVGSATHTLIDLLRSRYIIEFPRASQLGPGLHSVEVRVLHTHAEVYVTGLSVPMLDQKLRDDPNTIRYLEGDQPPVGTRRILPKSRPEEE